MEQRLKLIADWLDGYSITELSVIYGVSRKTVYKWIERYNRLGHDGIEELSRAPITHPNQTDEKIWHATLQTGSGAQTIKASLRQVTVNGAIP
jgi:transposase